jgi:hypothetical protein
MPPAGRRALDSDGPSAYRRRVRALWGVVAVAAMLVVAPPSASAGLVVPTRVVVVPGVAKTADVEVTAVGGTPVVGDVHIEVSAEAPASMDWLAIPGPVGQVTRLTNVIFALTLTVPVGVPDGQYLFHVRGVCDGVSEGSLTMIVAVGAAGLPMALDAPVFEIRPHPGRLAGVLRLTGTTPDPGTLTTLIVSKGNLLRRYRWALVPGGFARTLRLDLIAPPGKYSVRTTLARNRQAHEDWTITTSRSLSTVVAAPVQGLVDKAWISGRAGGPATPAFRIGTQALYASFHFAFVPRHGSITTTWYQPDGTPTRSVTKFRLSFVRGFVRSAAALTPGRWRCVLMVDGVTVAQASTQIH